MLVMGFVLAIPPRKECLEFLNVLKFGQHLKYPFFLPVLLPLRQLGILPGKEVTEQEEQRRFRDFREGS
jgi:hypothetical protein